MNYQYTVQYEPDEDGIIIATVPSLPGCHSFGNTQEEAEKNIEEAILCYIEAMKDLGKEIPKEDGFSNMIQKPISVSIPA